MASKKGAERSKKSGFLIIRAAEIGGRSLWALRGYDPEHDLRRHVADQDLVSSLVVGPHRGSHIRAVISEPVNEDLASVWKNDAGDYRLVIADVFLEVPSWRRIRSKDWNPEQMADFVGKIYTGVLKAVQAAEK